MKKFRISLGVTAAALTAALAVGFVAAPADAATMTRSTQPIGCC